MASRKSRFDRSRGHPLEGAAATDALKHAASMLGVALYLYSDDSSEETRPRAGYPGKNTGEARGVTARQLKARLARHPVHGSSRVT